MDDNGWSKNPLSTSQVWEIVKLSFCIHVSTGFSTSKSIGTKNVQDQEAEVVAIRGFSLLGPSCEWWFFWGRKRRWTSSKNSSGQTSSPKVRGPGFQAQKDPGGKKGTNPAKFPEDSGHVSNGGVLPKIVSKKIRLGGCMFFPHLSGEGC